MATAARFLGSLGLIVMLAACSQGAATTGPSAEAPAKTRGVMIAKVVTHDATLAIMSGGADKDLRVVVRKLDGTLVGDGLTLAELRVQQPELYEVVTSSYASAGGGTFVDATLGPMN